MAGTPDMGNDGPLGRKLMWFVGLWGASVLTLAVIGLLVKAVL